MTLRERVETTRGEAALAHLALTLLDELEAALRDRERLRAALRPFADISHVGPNADGDRVPTRDEIQGARAALRDTAP